MNPKLTQAISQVKEVARKDTWCTTHKNCFRWSLTGAESIEHVKAKFDLCLELREAGATIFTEVILEDGSRPDIIACWNNGTVEIYEIVKSESKESIEIKKKKYPFPLKVVTLK